MMAHDPADPSSVIIDKLVVVLCDHAPTGQAYIKSLSREDQNHRSVYVEDASVRFECFH